MCEKNGGDAGCCVIVSTGGLKTVVCAKARVAVEQPRTRMAICEGVGAAYLIWLGLRKFFGASDFPDVEGGLPKRSRFRLFREGFIVNLLNPKTALFFLTFLPQFVDVGRGHMTVQIAVLGIIYTMIGVLTDSSYALAAGTAGKWLKRSPVYLKSERWVSGLNYIGLGLTAAFAGNHKK